MWKGVGLGMLSRGNVRDVDLITFSMIFCELLRGYLKYLTGNGFWEETNMDEKDRQFIETLFIKQTEEFKHHVSAVAENFDLKIGLIGEGHQMLSDKLERIEARIDHVDSKIDKVELVLTGRLNKIAADVAAHRADTEAHHGVYRVKES
jgi:vacuolar-type H+-ATPase subunit I/STV1